MDGGHEDIGYEIFKKIFNKDVIEPIAYMFQLKDILLEIKIILNSLSNASKVSLKLQGGALNETKSKV